MANEYLKRTPTSSGNSRRWTLSFWMKNSDPTQGYTSIIGAGKLSPSNVYNEIYYTSSQIGLNLDNASASDNYNITANPLLRDSSSWMHVIVSFTDQGDNANTRIKFYINGAFTDHSTGTGLDVSETSFFNSVDYIHYIGSRAQQSAGTTTFDGQYFDVFLVDGQALTPDVFGFNKDGDGYISVGSTQATDFRPGQWMPHSPTKIKKDINRRGGFGANGFYLPMNDSSNPGADFHCDPNSIITLKGEDLPQPRNGAPTTSDAFVSQLRQETGTLGFDGAVKFDGTGDYLTFNGSSIDFGTGDFTVDAFVYHTGGNDDTIISDQTGFTFTYGNSGKLRFYHANGSNVVDATVNFISYRWVHVAVVRSSNTLTFYQDGNAVGSHAYNNDIGTNSTTTYIGKYFGGTVQDFDGFVSNLRVIQGTALYTANFTPPTEPLTNVTNTKLLCCNSSTSATAATVTPGTITAVGGAFATRNELSGSVVLAVPGINTPPTGSELVTNGTFDTDVSGWTITDTGTIVRQSDGTAKVTRGTSAEVVYQNITTVVGTTYELSVDITDIAGSHGQVYVYSTNYSGSLNTNIGYSFYTGTFKGTFTADTTTTRIALYAHPSGSTSYDNISVKATTIRDYSADIKGSGTNKTLAVNGDAGIRTINDTSGSAIGGYYGSAMQMGSGANRFTFPAGTDFAPGTGDFTVEAWGYPTGGNDGTYAADYFYSQAVGGQNYFVINFGTNTNAATGNIAFTMGTGGAGGGGGCAIAVNGIIPINQWTHFAVVRHGTTVTLYANGVAVGAETGVTFDLNNTTFVPTLGAYTHTSGSNFFYNGYVQDFRFYKGVAKYKGGFDVPKPYTPVGIESWRATTDTCKNNFVTMNPLAKGSKYGISDGNLSFTNSTTNWTGFIGSTHGFSTGKWYWETRINVSTAYHIFGIMDNEIKHQDISDAYFYGMTYQSDGRFYGENNGGASFSTGNTTAQTVGDVVMLAVDMDAKKMWLGINGTWLSSGNPSTGASPNWNSSRGFTDGHYYTPVFLSYGSSGMTANFGQNPSFSGQTTAGTNADANGKGLFKYAPPTGFLALCEDNLPTPAIADPGEHFKSVLWTGDGNNGHSITGVGFQPDLVWIKKRAGGTNRDSILFDSVRGPTIQLKSSQIQSESSQTDELLSFDEDGFSVGSGDNPNGNGNTYVAWCWKAGGAAVSNTDGTITSQVSANQTAGFSIVSYTGNGNTNQTVGHGLNKKPSLVIYKDRDSTSEWRVIPIFMNDGYYLSLSTTTARITSSTSYFGTNTSSVLGITGSNSGIINANTKKIIAYCWAEIEGFSKIGSYTGNSDTDGTFVYCGFKPAWLLVKRTDLGSSSYNWWIVDSSRSPVNGSNLSLYANLSNTEISIDGWDFLSNGFKARSSAANRNSSSGTYIFMAFAESPFQTANAK